MNDPNERRTLTAVVLMVAVFWVWSAFFGPQPEPSAATITEAAPAAASGSAGSPAVAATAVTPAEAMPVTPTATCTGTVATLSGPAVTLRASDCGSVSAIEFPAVPSAREVTSWWSWAWKRVSGSTQGGWVPYAPSVGSENLLSTEGEFVAAGRGDRRPSGVWAVVSESPLVQESRGADGLTITRTFTPATDDTWTVNVRFSSTQPLNGPFWVGVVDTFAPATDPYKSIPSLEALVDGDVEKVVDPGDVTETDALEGEVGWFGVADKYYLALLAPDTGAAGTLEWTPVGDKIGAFYVIPEASLAPASPIDAKFTLYTGPRQLERLKAAGHSFESAVSLGWFGFFANILLFTLYQFQFVIGNWGGSILALTLLVRLAVYPLTRTAVQSGRRMQALQPQMKALQEKFADDKEALQRETMALFSKNGVNPLGGCFPMLIQMPVFFALYAALSYEPSLFHAQFLYLEDLSVPDPYGALGLLIVAGMYVQQMITPMTGMDPTQQQMMKLMPLVFGFMMFGMPAGLSLYYALNTILAIVQQWYNTRSIPMIQPGEVNVAS